MSTYTRPVLLLLCGLLLLTLSIAVLNTLVPLWLVHENLPTWQVGMVGSSYFTGNLVGTLITGWLIKRQGFNRSYYIAAVIFAAACVGLGITVNFWAWMGWRFVAGVGCAMIWVVVESGLLCSGNATNRGRLLAAYMMAYYIGTVAGQILITKLPTDLMSVLPWVTAIVIVAILPLLFARLVDDDNEDKKPVSVWPMFRLRNARLGVNGCVISGIVLGSLYGLMPLYLNHQGISDGKVGYWMALMISAGIVGQWPVGRLADKFGRLLVLRVQVLVVIIGCLAMFTHTVMGPTLFILGASGFTLYPVAMAWACEKVAHHQLVAMNQALLLSYTIGSLLGPSFTSLLMQNYSDNLLFIAIALVNLIYLFMLLRKTSGHATPVAHA